MIVLDELLSNLRMRSAIRDWYLGKVVYVRELRPGTVIKDDVVPRLLRRQSRSATIRIRSGAPVMYFASPLMVWSSFTPETMPRYSHVKSCRPLGATDDVPISVTPQSSKTRQTQLNQTASYGPN
jgi:hypothetical protein